MKRYTKDEDQIIINSVKDNIGNLSEGFRQASLSLKKTQKAIVGRWYGALRSHSNALTLKSDLHNINNYKNVNKTSNSLNLRTETIDKLVASLTSDQKINLLKELIK